MWFEPAFCDILNRILFHPQQDNAEYISGSAGACGDWVVELLGRNENSLANLQSCIINRNLISII